MKSDTDPSTAHDLAATPLARILRNTAFNVAGTVLMAPLTFVAIFTIARRLGKESIGLYFTILAVAVAIHAIMESGLTLTITRRIARHPERMRRTVAEATGMLSIVATGSALLLLAAGVVWAWWRGEPVPWDLFILAAIGVAFRQMMEFTIAVFRGLERFEFENATRVLQASIFCGLVVALVYPSTGGTQMVLLVFALANVLSAIFITSILVIGWRCAGYRCNLGIMRNWWGESLPIGIGDTIRRVSWQVDTLLLGILQSAAVVGLYSVAYRPLQPLQLVPRAVASVTFPSMSRAADLDRKSLSTMFGHSITLLWIVSLPICVVVTLFAHNLVVVPAGEAFAEAATPLRILIWMLALTFVVAQLRFLLTAINKQRTYCRLAILGIVTKLTLALLLIPTLSLYGACIATFAGELAMVIAGLVVVAQAGIVGLQWSRMARAIPAAAIMAALLGTALDAHWIWQVAISFAGGAIYLLLCIAFAALDRDEVVHAWKTLQSLRARRTARRNSRLSLATTDLADEIPRPRHEAADPSGSDVGMSDTALLCVPQTNPATEIVSP